MTKGEGTSAYWGGHQQPLPQHLRLVSPGAWRGMVLCLTSALSRPGPFCHPEAEPRGPWSLGPEDREVLEVRQAFKGTEAERQ